MTLEKFFNPRSVAVIGATENPENITSTIITNLLGMRYEGRLVPVNPHHDEVFGLKCYPSLPDIRERIDLAVISIPSDHVPAVLEQQAECGIKNSIIISGGFSETGGKGIGLEKRIKQICGGNGIRLIGPNCIGVLDNYANFSTSFLPWTKVQRPIKGHLGILSQSGSYVVSMMDMLSQEGIGVSKMVSYGNRADVGESELIEYLTDDEQTRVIGIYMESVDDGRRFINAAGRFTETKHIVAIKAGRHGSGIEAARSHTGAIAGRYEIYKAAFRKSGIVEVHGLTEFADACKALLMQKPARGNRVLVLTNGGGFGVSVSDLCCDVSLDVAHPPASIRDELSKKFPEYFILNNPIDMTGSSGDEDYGTAMKAALVDNDFFDAAIVIPLMPPPTMTEGVVDVIARKAEESGKPVVICMVTNRYTEKVKAKFEEKGLPVFPSPERCVRAMRVLVERGRMHGG